jgi:hypothetical protein
MFVLVLFLILLPFKKKPSYHDGLVVAVNASKKKSSYYDHCGDVVVVMQQL